MEKKWQIFTIFCLSSCLFLALSAGPSHADEPAPTAEKTEQATADNEDVSAREDDADEESKQDTHDRAEEHVKALFEHMDMDLSDSHRDPFTGERRQVDEAFGGGDHDGSATRDQPRSYRHRFEMTQITNTDEGASYSELTFSRTFGGIGSPERCVNIFGDIDEDDVWTVQTTVVYGHEGVSVLSDVTLGEDFQRKFDQMIQDCVVEELLRTRLPPGLEEGQKAYFEVEFSFVPAQ